MKIVSKKMKKFSEKFFKKNKFFLLTDRAGCGILEVREGSSGIEMKKFSCKKCLTFGRACGTMEVRVLPLKIAPMLLLLKIAPPAQGTPGSGAPH